MNPSGKKQDLVRLKAAHARFDLIEALEAAPSIDAVRVVCDRFALQTGLDYFSYAARDRSPHPKDYNYFNNYPADWSRLRYAELPKQKFDPVLEHVKRNLPPAAWSSQGYVLGVQQFAGPAAREMLGKAGEHGLLSGMTVPTFSETKMWSFFTFATTGTAEAREIAELLPFAYLFAAHAHHRIEAMTGPGLQPLKAPLTPREVDVLRYRYEGFQYKVIASLLRISEKTVYSHLSDAAAKLGVRPREAQYRARLLRAI